MAGSYPAGQRYQNGQLAGPVNWRVNRVRIYFWQFILEIKWAELYVVVIRKIKRCAIFR